MKIHTSLPTLPHDKNRGERHMALEPFLINETAGDLSQLTFL